ncbi:MAG: hypothetical protein JW951_02305 [Lentisphaerae bacterium]|nr:hypothetical protein [Lentisphaerota bacterium]
MSSVNTARHKAFRRATLLVRLIAVAAVCVLAGGAYLGIVGFPGWLERRILGRLSPRGMTLEASRIRLDHRGGLAFRDVALYRQGVVGPPFFEAARVNAALEPAALVRSDTPLWTVRGVEAVFRGEQRDRRAGDAARTALAPPPRETRDDARAGPRQTSGVRIELQAFDFWGLPLESLEGVLWRSESAVALEDINARVRGDGGGPVRGALRYTPREALLTGRLETGFDPRLALPFVRAAEVPALARVIERFRFDGPPPRFDLAFSRARGQRGGVYALEGRYWMEACAYNEVPALRVDGRLQIDATATNTVVALDPMLVVREEGIARGGLSVRYPPGEVVFHGRSGIDPDALLAMTGALKGRTTPWRCHGPAVIEAQGRVGLRPGARTAFEADMACRDVELAGYRAETAAFTLEVRGRTNRLNGVRGTLYGGAFEGDATFVRPATPTGSVRYVVSASLHDANFEPVAAVLTADAQKAVEGRLSGNIRVAGLMGAGRGRSVAGRGSLKIVRGRLFLLPLFGELSDFLTKTIPGLDFVLRQSDARADFRIAGGGVHSDKVRIEGDILSLVGAGRCGFDGALDFDVQLTFMKEHTLVARLLRTVTYPLSKLLEFRLSGTVDEPHWYPVHWPGDPGRKDGTAGQ